MCIRDIRSQPLEKKKEKKKLEPIFNIFVKFKIVRLFNHKFLLISIFHRLIEYPF